MSAPATPAALQALKRELLERRAPSAVWLSAIAKLRLACGDGQAAARWQRWSLQPPAAEELQDQVRELLLLSGDIDGASELARPQSWGLVQVALARGSIEQAQQLQDQLLAAQTPLHPRLRLSLVNHWRERHQPQPALTLLMGLPHLEHSAPHCNLAAALLEQSNNWPEAAIWWERSLSLQPDQIFTLARCAGNALALGDIARAEHWAQTLLRLDPLNPVGHNVLAARSSPHNHG